MTADASAVEPEQSNSIAAAPTDSSGALNATQGNDVTVTGAAANGSATGQEAGGESTVTAPPPETDQQAATDQAANATASAVEPHQSNVVIIIRINSPGDDVISQTNVVSVVGVAANEGSTAQHQGPTTQNPAPAGAPASGTSDPTQSQPAGGPTPPTDGQPQPSGAVPQSAQSAKAAERLVQPADAVQGKRPHSARALSILGSSAGSNASPPAPESKAVSAPRSAASDDGSVAGRETEASRVAPVGSAMATRGASSEHTVAHRSDGKTAGRVGAILKKVVSWPGKHSSAVGSAATAEGAEGGWNLGLTTLAILLAGLIGWLALARLPSLRGLSRPRNGG